MQLGTNVYVGFAVASNNPEVTCIAEFSDLEVTGAVSSDWQIADVGAAIPGNDPGQLYVGLQDSAQALGVWVHPNPAVTQMGQWWKLNIPLTAFSGVNLKSIGELILGVGNGEPGGTGTVVLRDIRVVNPTTVITSVVRADGQSGNRPPIGVYDGSTSPLPTEPGGLKDGNYCFSDRVFTWSNTPFELTGAEYVRMFNSDKALGETDVTYTVTLSRSAIVFITIDDRIPVEWDGDGTILSKQEAADRVTAAFAPAGTFTDTGLHLFVHEDAATDTQMSVFAAELQGGTYVFKSPDSNKDHYTIGALK